MEKRQLIRKNHQQTNLILMESIQSGNQLTGKIAKSLVIFSLAGKNLARENKY